MIRIDRALRIVTLDVSGDWYWPTWDELARFSARWAILLTFGVTTCYYGASTEARDQTQVVLDARTVYDAMGRCTAMLDRGLDAGDRAGAALAQRSIAQQWVLASRGIEYVATNEPRR